MIQQLKRCVLTAQYQLISACHRLARNKTMRVIIGGLVVGFFLHNAAYGATGSDPFDPSTNDLLGGARKDVTTQFGSDSFFMYAVYFIEFVLGVAAYIKTKNPLVFAGLLVLVIVTHVVMAKFSAS